MVMAVLCILLLAGGGAGYWYYTKDDSTTTTTTTPPPDNATNNDKTKTDAPKPADAAKEDSGSLTGTGGTSNVPQTGAGNSVEEAPVDNQTATSDPTSPPAPSTSSSNTSTPSTDQQANTQVINYTPPTPDPVTGLVPASSVTDNYSFFVGFDSDGNDVGATWGKTVQQLKEICDEKATCKGFNTNGYLKGFIRPQSEWRDYGKFDSLWYRSIPEDERGLYVKN